MGYPNTPTKQYRQVIDVVATDEHTPAESLVGVQIGDNATVATQISGTFTGTLQFEVSLDGITFYPIDLAPPSGDAASTATEPGIFAGNVAGYAYFQVRATALSAGSATVTLKLSELPR